MKEYLKIIDKKKMILVLFFSIIYNLSIYDICYIFLCFITTS